MGQLWDGLKPAEVARDGKDKERLQRRRLGVQSMAARKPKRKSWFEVNEMCDYSLMAVPNRLAREGEELVLHRFVSGSIGLASPPDPCLATGPSSFRTRTFWSAVKDFFNPPESQSVPAVCIPPGARLMLHDIPTRIQNELGVGSDEEVTFTQISASVNSYRDAVRFSGGREVRLQELGEGQRIKVLDLSMAEDPIPDLSEFDGVFVRRRE